jgi:hypothetical protein
MLMRALFASVSLARLNACGEAMGSAAVNATFHATTSVLGLRRNMRGHCASRCRNATAPPLDRADARGAAPGERQLLMAVAAVAASTTVSCCMQSYMLSSISTAAPLRM